MTNWIYTTDTGWVKKSEKPLEEREPAVHVRNYDNNLCWNLSPGTPGFRHYHPVTGQGVITSKADVERVKAMNPGVLWDR